MFAVEVNNNYDNYYYVMFTKIKVHKIMHVYNLFACGYIYMQYMYNNVCMCVQLVLFRYRILFLLGCHC